MKGKESAIINISNCNCFNSIGDECIKEDYLDTPKSIFKEKEKDRKVEV
jgi:hypothetical protein